MTASDDVLRALEDLGETTPAELAAATGSPSRTVTHALRRLRDAGLVDGSKSSPRLSPAARARARLPVPVGGGEFDEAVEAIFGPSPALSAFARLAADLIVARQLYPGRSFYPALLAYGVFSGIGKTALAELLAAALDLGTEAIVVMGHKAPGEVVGRRVSLEGGGYRFEPAEHLAFPFVCLDELGDADAEVRRHARALCHGEPVVTIEGSRVELRATVMATWNPSGATVFGEPNLRRALVLCVDAPGVRIADLARRLRDAELAGTGRASLRLSALRATPALSDDVLGVLEDVFDALTEAGRVRVDRRLLELATLGRAARYQLGAGDELGGVAYCVGADLLIVTETVPGLVDDDWSVQLENVAARWGDVPGLARLAASAARRVELRKNVTAAATERRALEERDDLELTGTRAKLRAIFDEAAKAILHVPPAHRPAAAELRAKLRRLRDDAGDARSMLRLEELAELGRLVIEEACRLEAWLEHERTGAEQEKAERQAQATMAIAERKRQDEARRVALAADGQRQKQIRASASAELNEWRPVVKKLEQLYGRTSTRANERADVILGGYRLPDGRPLLQWYQDPPLPPPEGNWEKVGNFLSMFAAAEPPGRWVSAWDESVTFSATAGGCPALRLWGANTRRMIAPLLREALEHEDALALAAGRKKRERRFNV